MERILCFILIVCVLFLIHRLLNKDKQDHFSDVIDKDYSSLPPMYPISVDHDYNNYTNLAQSGALGKINELTDIVMEKINDGTHMIIFNSALRQTELLPLNDNESIDYGKLLVNTMNENSIYKNYKYRKIVNISKNQMENQIRLNFHLDVDYVNNTEKIPLTFNVVVLFQQLYDDDDKFFETAGAKNNNVSVYLDELRLNDMPNNGFMPGYEKN